MNLLSLIGPNEETDNKALTRVAKKVTIPAGIEGAVVVSTTKTGLMKMEGLVDNTANNRSIPNHWIYEPSPII